MPNLIYNLYSEYLSNAYNDSYVNLSSSMLASSHITATHNIDASDRALNLSRRSNDYSDLEEKIKRLEEENEVLRSIIEGREL